MEYSKIIAVTGLPGLYELINSKTDGAIVRSLEDKGARFVSSRIHQFSHLESIEVYTTRENVNLVTILKAMEESGEKLPDEKDNEALKKYFQKVYGELDFDRVYSSDLKKMVKWFSILKKNNVEFKLSEIPEETEAAVEEPKPAPAAEKKEKPAVEKPVEEKPKAKAKAKPAEKEKEEKPAPKKKAAEKEKEAKPKAKTKTAEKEKTEKAAPKKKAKK